MFDRIAIFILFIITIRYCDQIDSDQRSAIRIDRIAIDRRSEKTPINKPVYFTCGATCSSIQVHMVRLQQSALFICTLL